MTRFFAIYKDPNISIGTAALISIIAILIVFLVLIIIIAVCYLCQKGIEKISILPKEENKILEEDKDAVVALLVATIDFKKETGKEPEVISIKRIED